MRLAAGVAGLATLFAVRSARSTESPADGAVTRPSAFFAELGSNELVERANQLKQRGWADVLDPRAASGYRNGRRSQIDIVTVSGAEVEVQTAQAFMAMRAAAAERGIDLWIESGFRTRDEQAVLYRAWRKGRGNKAARPGHSNHQSGRALDIAVSSPGALAWLSTNASRFGFKRTVRGEPWHWEYVNTPRARGKHHRRYASRGKHGKKRGAKAARAGGSRSKSKSKSHRRRVASR
ncbi:MAG TPA: M15 family metallopeptidase [Kofleriaceae bacterium]|nr:M15 family metallopeptidase [Kofleriaceae bacterium]